MLDDLKTRDTDAPARRGPGRPKKADSKPDEIAQVLPPTNYVPPLICPHCGQGMTPRVLAGFRDGVRRCQCTQCGKTIQFTPAKVKPVN
jgi:uncharacterized protein (DUF983 family)